MKRIIRKLFRSKKAQSMVEMAIMLPVLLLVLFAITDLGLILGAKMIIHELARDGVRAGVVGTTDTSIKTQIKNNDRFLNINDNNIDISLEYIDDDGVIQKPTERIVGNPLTVKIIYDKKIITPIISKLIEDEGDKPGHKTLETEYVMRIEQLP